LFRNSAGAVSFSRTEGKVISLDVIPKNTVMLFYQAAVPAGWEQITSGTADSVFAPTFTAPGGAAPTVGGERVTDVEAGKDYNWSFKGIGTTTGASFGTTETFTLTEENIPEHTHSYTPPAAGSPHGKNGGIANGVIGTPTSSGAWGGDEGDTTPHGHDIKQNGSVPWRPIISVCLVCKKK